MAAVCLLSVVYLGGVAMAVEDGTDVIARLGTTEFTSATLADFVRSLDRNVRAQALRDPQLMERLVGAEIARLELLSEAKAKKWEQRTDVAQQIERARAQIVVSSYLGSVAAVPRNYPSEAEIKSAYDANRDSFMAPRQYRLSQIFVRLPATSDKKVLETAQKKAEGLARQAKARGADFAAIARLSSEHAASATKGGDLGWADQNALIPEIRNFVAGMESDEISDPILSSSGWHIIRMVDTKPAAPRPLAEVRDTLVATLRERKAQEMQQTYVARLLEKTPVMVNQARLRTLFETAP
jgi:peptidylprolyl isomerase